METGPSVEKYQAAETISGKGKLSCPLRQPHAYGPAAVKGYWMQSPLSGPGSCASLESTLTPENAPKRPGSGAGDD